MLGNKGQRLQLTFFYVPCCVQLKRNGSPSNCKGDNEESCVRRKIMPESWLARRLFRKFTAAAYLAICAVASSGAVSADMQPVSALLSLLQDGRLEDCRVYLRERQVSHPDADSLYVSSICALRSNHPYQARAQLTKLLAVRTDYPGAWFAKAQADFLIRDHAELEISRVAMLTSRLPPEQRETAKAWLQSLNISETRQTIIWNAEVGAGSNSNANAGTVDSDYLGTAIPRTQKRTASDFYESSFGLGMAKGQGIFSDLIGSIQISRRSNSSAPFVNQSLVSAAVTYRHPLRKWLAEYSILGLDERIAGVPQRQFGALEFSIYKRASDFWEYAFIGRAGRLNYRVSDRPDLNVWRFLWSLNTTRLFGDSLKNRVGIGIFGGGDEEVIYRSSFGNSRFGVRVFGETEIGAHLKIGAEGAFSTTSFDVHGGFSGISRLDGQLSVLATATWKAKPSSPWSIQARLVHRNLDSNVSVFRFDQNSVGIFVKIRGK